MSYGDGQAPPCWSSRVVASHGHPRVSFVCAPSFVRHRINNRMSAEVCSSHFYEVLDALMTFRKLGVKRTRPGERGWTELGPRPDTATAIARAERQVACRLSRLSGTTEDRRRYERVAVPCPSSAFHAWSRRRSRPTGSERPGCRKPSLSASVDQDAAILSNALWCRQSMSMSRQL